MQSWAQWLAEALALPFTKLARDGALARDVLGRAGPAPGRSLRRRRASTSGVNDARSLEWDRRRLRAGAARERRGAGGVQRAAAAVHPAHRPRPPARRAQAARGERHRPRRRRRARRRARRPRRPRGPAVAAARRGPPHRARPARDRRSRGPRPRRPVPALVAHRGPPLAPRPRALRSPLGRDAGARPAPARRRARARALARSSTRRNSSTPRSRTRDEAGDARRLDGEGGEADRRAPDELQPATGQALAAHGDRDRGAPAVQSQRAGRPPGAGAERHRAREREARARIAVGLDARGSAGCRRGAPGRSATVVMSARRSAASTRSPSP